MLTAYLLAIANEAKWEIPAGAARAHARRARALRRRQRHARRDRRTPPICRCASSPRSRRSPATAARRPRWSARSRSSRCCSPNGGAARLDLACSTACRRSRSATRASPRPSALLRARLDVQGTTLGFATSRGGVADWLLATTDVNAAKLVLSRLARAVGWHEDVPRLMRAALSLQRGGAWPTTTANAWGVLALEGFSRVYEATPVTGHDDGAASARREERVAWAACAEGRARCSSPGRDARAALALRHDGTGAPWALVQSLAALPLHAAARERLPHREELGAGLAAHARPLEPRRRRARARQRRGRRAGELGGAERSDPGRRDAARPRPRRRLALLAGSERDAGRGLGGLHRARPRGLPPLLRVRAEGRASRRSTPCASTRPGASSCRRRASRRCTRPSGWASARTRRSRSRRERRRARARRARRAASRVGAAWWATRPPALPDFAAVRARFASSEARAARSPRRRAARAPRRPQRAPPRLDAARATSSPVLVATLIDDARTTASARTAASTGSRVAAALRDGAARGRVRGASTLTMQLAALLDPSLRAGAIAARRRSRSCARCAPRARSKRRWSKDEILEAYLNLASFRGELQGVAAASRGLFDRDPHGLGEAEAALLTALLRAPNARPRRRRGARLPDRGAARERRAVRRDRGAQRAASSRRRPPCARARALAPHLAARLLRDAAPAPRRAPRSTRRSSASSPRCSRARSRSCAAATCATPRRWSSTTRAARCSPTSAAAARCRARASSTACARSARPARASSRSSTRAPSTASSSPPRRASTTRRSTSSPPSARYRPENYDRALPRSRARCARRSRRR